MTAPGVTGSVPVELRLATVREGADPELSFTLVSPASRAKLSWRRHP